MSEAGRQADALCFVYTSAGLLVSTSEGGTGLPTVGGLRACGLAVEQALAVGDLGGQACVALHAPEDLSTLEGLSPVGLRALFTQMPEAHWGMAARAWQLLHWQREHQYCGRCGQRAARDLREFAMVCEACGSRQYPKVTPAVIVLVEDGPRLLLGRGAHFRPGVYSPLAGFVEPGESLEEAVKREVREEAGIEIDNLRYFSSQCWPFPSTIMVGFRARYAGGELRREEQELEDLQWFTRDRMPVMPDPCSIAYRLMKDALG